MGAGGKAGVKRIPPIIFSLNSQQSASYLRGYFDGDGCVERDTITAVSKSKDLISDLSYLLLRFGIITRMSKKFKRATNANHKGDNYWELRISGQDNIKKYAKHINFIHPERKQKLKKLVSKTNQTPDNTNVDTIPTLAPLFRKLYNQLFSGTKTHTDQSFIAIKNGVYNPSPKELLKHIAVCRKRIKQIRAERNQIHQLNSLPSLEGLIKKGKRKPYNALLWQELGQTWRLMKNQQVQPYTSTVLQAHKTISGETITTNEVITSLQNSCFNTGLSLWQHNKNLSPVQTKIHLDTPYQYVSQASKHLLKKYRSLQLKIRHAEKILKRLEVLASSDLFWDPIVKIKKLEHNEKYVYDLQVDNEVFLAGHGGMFIHNSYFVKLETLRSLMFGSEVIVIDPENEYEMLSKAVGGQYTTFSFNSQAKINPFDLSTIFQEGENELGQKILSLHGLLKIMLGKMSAPQEALLDRALVSTYKAKGITPDPATQKYEPPLMEDLYKSLIGMETPEALDLSSRLEKYVKGSFRGVFDQRTNIDLKNHFTVFSIKDLKDELRPIAMYIILDYVWTTIKKDLKKRLLVVDEAWHLMKYPDTANFLYSIAKRARKYYLGLTTITQDVADFLHTDHGKAIVTNSSIQILMKQSTAAIDEVAKVFYLSQGERHLLLSADIGEGLFFAGSNHVAIRIVASPQEHKLITTKPQEIISQKPTPPPVAPSPPAVPTPTPTPIPPPSKPQFKVEVLPS